MQLTISACFDFVADNHLPPPQNLEKNDKTSKYDDSAFNLSSIIDPKNNFKEISITLFLLFVFHCQ